MNNHELLDNFAMCGTGMPEFEDAIDKMSAATKSIIAEGADIVFLSPYTLPAGQRAGMYSFYKLDKKSLTDFVEQGTKLHIVPLPCERFDKEIADEMMAGNCLLAVIESKMFVMSNMSLPTLSLRTGVGGISTCSHQTIIRDMHIAHECFKNNEPINFVYRESESEDGVVTRKIFAALGKTFKLFSQKSMKELVDSFDNGSMGKLQTRNWHINHSISRIFLDFPEVAEEWQKWYHLPSAITPGLCIQTSDIGDSSLMVLGIYRFPGNSYVVMDKASKKHTLNNDVKACQKSVEKTIFANFRKFPEAMGKLIGIYTYGNENSDLTDEDEGRLNKTQTLSIIQSALEKAAPSVGPKALVALLDQLSSEINPMIHYTYYDVAMMCMNLPDRIEGVGDHSREILRKECVNVPFVLAASLTPAEENYALDFSEVFLLPE